MEIGSLDNGMRYLFVSDKRFRSVSVVLSIKVGSRNEVEKYYGLTHFIEHMLFKGTKKRESSEIAGDIDKYGGNINAFVDFDMTAYHIKISPEYLEHAIDVLSDMFYNSQFKNMNPEKNVVINEIIRAESSPIGLLENITIPLVFKHTNLEHIIVGTKEDVKRVQLPDILGYMKKFYTPKNMVITVTGDFKNETALELISKYFSKKPRYERGNPHYISLKLYPNFMDIQDKLRYVHQTRDYSQAYLSIAFPSYPMRTREAYIADVISIILGGNMSSRLFMEVREKLGLVYSIKSNLLYVEDMSMFRITCGTFNKNSKIKKVLKTILKELDKLTQTITQEEVDKGIEFIIGRGNLSRESSMSIALNYGTQYLLLNDIITYEEEAKIYRSIQAYEVKQISSELFVPHRMNISLISKKEVKESVIKKWIN